MTIKETLGKVWQSMKSKDKPIIKVSPETKAKVRKVIETYRDITGPAPTTDKMLNDDPLGYKQLFGTQEPQRAANPQQEPMNHTKNFCSECGRPMRKSNSDNAPHHHYHQDEEEVNYEQSRSKIEDEVQGMFSGIDADSVLDGFPGYEPKRRRGKGYS